MMDMLERMMGMSPDGDPPQDDGKKPGNASGNGTTGDSQAANTASAGDAAGKTETRRVPKASGTNIQGMPQEFHKALDAYNRGLTETVK